MAKLNVGDVELYYREAGSGSPLLLIHGAGGHADLFEAAIPALAQQHRVIAYDRRGYSRSCCQPAPRKGYLERQAEDAAALLRGLAGAPATVVGWSNGGIIALCLALDHPELVSRVVAFEPPLHANGHMPLSQLPRSLQVMFLSSIGRKRSAAIRFYRMLLARADGGNAFDELDAATREGILGNVDTLMHEVQTGSGEELTSERVKQLKCPISTLVGTDTMFAFSDAVKRLAKLLPQMPVLELPGAGHLGPMTHAAEFARLTLQSPVGDARAA